MSEIQPDQSANAAFVAHTEPQAKKIFNRKACPEHSRRERKARKKESKIVGADGDTLVYFRSLRTLRPILFSSSVAPASRFQYQ